MIAATIGLASHHLQLRGPISNPSLPCSRIELRPADRANYTSSVTALRVLTTTHINKAEIKNLLLRPARAPFLSAGFSTTNNAAQTQAETPVTATTNIHFRMVIRGNRMAWPCQLSF
jgi:hypothetical protein